MNACRLANFALVLPLVLLSCSGEDEQNISLPRPEFPASQPRLSQILELVERIPADASREQLRRELDAVVAEVGRATRAEMERVYEALAVLRNQPNVIAAFADFYYAIPAGEASSRLFTLGIVGELQRPDAIDFLGSVVWGPLPEPERRHGLTPRDAELALMRKAVQGIAYLRTVQAEEEMERILSEHSSKLVRIAAIDAYMWNRGDSAEAAERLYTSLPDDLHMYVEMPRFHRDMSTAKFEAHLHAWQKKWGKPKRH